MRKLAFAVAVAATKTIRTRCEGDSGKQCHDEIRPEPQCWRGAAGFCIALLAAEGLTVLAQRLGVRCDALTGASLFVLGRYGAHFSGHSNADSRAAWSDWGHVQRERARYPAASAREMFDNLVKEMTKAKEEVQPESLMLPLPGLALVLNPTKQPGDMASPRGHIPEGE